MTLPMTPHTVTVFAASQTPAGAGKVVSAPTYAATGTEVDGQLVSKGATSVFNSHGVELANPHLFLMNLADKGNFPFNAKVTYGVRTFFVKSQVRIFDFGDDTDYASVALEESNYAS